MTQIKGLQFKKIGHKFGHMTQNLCFVKQLALVEFKKLIGCTNLSQ
jgi:hypothetical protein